VTILDAIILAVTIDIGVLFAGALSSLIAGLFTWNEKARSRELRAIRDRLDRIEKRLEGGRKGRRTP
jgi:hypothetical protein